MKYLCVMLWFFVVFASCALAYTPLILPVLLLLFSVVAYLAYARDKRAAESGDWRVPENTLHLFALLGGWPGAFLAQQRLRHKTRKLSFRLGFWVTVLLNVGVLAWLHTPDGNVQLLTIVSLLERLFTAQLPPGVVRDVLLTLFSVQLYI